MRKAVLLGLILFAFANAWGQKEQPDSLAEVKQKANVAYTNLYKENSEMSYTSPGGEIGAPSGYVINGKLTTSYLVFAPRTLPLAFSVNPDFTVRVRTDRSAGVRTPSFRLGGTLYVRLNDDAQYYRYAQVGFTHHSNGQDGAAVLPDGKINTQTGNFNTNYLSAAYRFGRFTDVDTDQGRSYSFHHLVGLEAHRFFNYEKALDGDYGFTRVNYDFSFRVYQIYRGKKGSWKKANTENKNATATLEKETWRFNAAASYAVNKYDTYSFFAPKRRLNVEASANYSLPFMQNVFVMASAGYYGEDPYNIYFKDKYPFVRFGLSSTFTRYRVR